MYNLFVIVTDREICDNRHAWEFTPQRSKVLLRQTMNLHHFQSTLSQDQPPRDLSSALQSLWWDAKGNWTKAHALVDELETPEGMAVHAYLHRKEGEDWNADYWYKRAGRQYRRNSLNEEWKALVEGLP